MEQGTAHARPTRAEIDPAALALIQRHGAAILSTARKYSLSPEDAEDAYQRGLEILLTKAPTTRESDLVPWLKTVVKHEAFAIRRTRTRTKLVGDERGLADACGLEPPAEIHAERLERLRLGAEAMARLKPQEIRCLVLRAEGFSYAEISEATGFSLTKVNRSLTEGRAAFRRGVAGIEEGAECERLTPLLSRLADGEANADDMRALRPHLRGCLACRTALRDYREAPSQVAGVMPAGLLAGGGLFARFAEAFALLKVKLAVAVCVGGAVAGSALVPPKEPPPAPKRAPVQAASTPPSGRLIDEIAQPAPRAHDTQRPARRTRPALRTPPSAQPASVTQLPPPATPPAPAEKPAATQPGEFSFER